VKDQQFQLGEIAGLNIFDHTSKDGGKVNVIEQKAYTQWRLVRWRKTKRENHAESIHPSMVAPTGDRF
jgi:hypothetical protein